MAKHHHSWVMRDKGGVFVFCRTCPAQVRVSIVDLPRHVAIAVRVLAGRVSVTERERLCDQVHRLLVDVRCAPARAV